MAAPIIDSITVVPDTIHECETAVITITAREPLSGDVTLKLQVANALSEVAQRDVIVHLAGHGPLIYGLTEVPSPDLPLGHIVQDPAKPHVFRYTAPCPDDPDHDPTTHGTLPHPH